MDYNLCDYNTVKKILSAHGFNFSKALGQNFIIDDSICPAMAEMLGADEKQVFLKSVRVSVFLQRNFAKERARWFPLNLTSDFILF